MTKKDLIDVAKPYVEQIQTENKEVALKGCVAFLEYLICTCNCAIVDLHRVRQEYKALKKSRNLHRNSYTDGRIYEIKRLFGDVLESNQDVRHEKFVSYDQALKLKEKGFKWEVSDLYVRGKELGELKSSNLYPIHYTQPHDWNNLDPLRDNEIYLWSQKVECSRPTLEQTREWLREEHQIYIELEPLYTTFSMKIWDKRVTPIGRTGLPAYDTYEKAMRVAIEKALEMI